MKLKKAKLNIRIIWIKKLYYYNMELYLYLIIFSIKILNNFIIKVTRESKSLKKKPQT